MSRSGYSDSLDDCELNLYRGRVARTIKGKRGQAFLRELAAAMESMPEKVLIANEMIDENGDCCADEWGHPDETPQHRWARIRRWVAENCH